MSTNGKPYINDAGIIKAQGKHFVREFDLDGVRHIIDVHARLDDECGNGHETFSLTAWYWEKGRSKENTGGGGCCHDVIVQAMPELEPLVKWHLCSTDGPMHYEANTVYLAGNRDYNGRRKGEPSSFRSRIRFGDFPMTWAGGRWNGKEFIRWLDDQRGPDGNVYGLTVLSVQHKDKPGETYKFGPKFTFNSPRGHFGDSWADCPFDSEEDARQFLDALAWCQREGGGWFVERVPVAWSDGKERELDAARRCAIWPDATDAELMQEPEALRAALRDRLPGLLADFREAMTSEPLGFVWPERLADVGVRS